MRVVGCGGAPAVPPRRWARGRPFAGAVSIGRKATVVVDACVARRNTARGPGGVADAFDSAGLAVARSRLTRNAAGEDGGAVRVGDAARARVDGCAV
eukprot:gene2860-5760_t